MSVSVCSQHVWAEAWSRPACCGRLATVPAVRIAVMAAPSLIGASADEALTVVRRDLNVLEAANGQATVAERRAVPARAPRRAAARKN